MILEEFALLASDTARTKAYLQAMIRDNKLPGLCVVYSDDISGMKEEAEKYQRSVEAEKYFDRNIPILFSLNEAGISYLLLENKDINSEQMKDVLLGLKQKYLIYSGYGGYILKEHLFHMDKKFIHVHAGILPQYRGSTTAYYSFLQEKEFGATAIFLSEGIDEGEMIVQETFPVPEEPVNIDYIYEPYIRSRVLLKAIGKYLQNGELVSGRQPSEGAETYYIIHPLLKHLAIMGIEKTIGRRIL
ncbi:MAG: hypothetical protein K2L82_03055 [Lachnospiraceae bacterium]|nr:hypothetical protein [Lachnospiraceae bacterium]